MPSAIKLNLTEAVIALARRPGGMVNTDLPGVDSYTVGQCCSRLRREGRIHCVRTDRRNARYYGSAEAAAQGMDPVTLPAAPEQAEAAIESLTIIDAKGRPADASHARITVIPPPAGSIWAARCAPARRMPSDLPVVVRAGSTDHHVHPSRSGAELRYRDGRIDHLEA